MSENAEGTGAAPAASGKDEQTWGMLCHLSALAMFIVPFGNVIGPLVVWLIKKDQYPLVDREGKKALNFQITMAIAGLALTVVGMLLIVVLIGIPILILGGLALFVFELVMIIMASMKTSKGEDFTYAFSIEFLK